MLISLLLLAAVQDPLATSPELRDTPPRLISSEPVIIPPDFCIMYKDREKTCSADVSFDILTDGSVSNIEITRSSRVWACDRAVASSIRSRIYERSGGFSVHNEAVQSQTCRALRGR